MSVSSTSSPTPNFRRLMGFVDGENLVFSYEKMLTNGYVPKADTDHLRKVFVWNKNTINANQLEVLRMTYYTYAIGSNEYIDNVRTKIKSLVFNQYFWSVLPNSLAPVVFKKSKQSQKTKGVDIKMTVDILSHCYNDNLDTVLIVAGDGDYLPIIKEALRKGKQIHLAFFSKGLNKDLLNHVDKFISLDDIYFEEMK